MTGKYAATTEVAPERSRAEIERLLTRYGATSYAYGWDAETNVTVIGCRMQGRQLRFRLPMPNPQDAVFRFTPSTRQRRSEKATTEAYEQEVRRRWRALALVIKAKLEAVETGISTFEAEFLAAILLPDGRTYGEFATPQIERVYQTGEMPALLPGLRPSDIRALGEGTQA